MGPRSTGWTCRFHVFVSAISGVALYRQAKRYGRQTEDTFVDHGNDISLFIFNLDSLD
jgi:hypothetical protein